VLQYLGHWPQNLRNQDAASSALCAPLPLPHLRSLKLQGFGSNPPPWIWFMGAQPLKVSADDVMIERWLPLEYNNGVASAAASSSGGVCPLAAVRTLQVTVRSPVVFTPRNVARLLHAAPQLETLIVFGSGVKADESWLEHPASDDGLVHSKLRQIRISGLPRTTDLSAGRLASLRRRHFPRLKLVAIDGRECFDPPLESHAASNATPAVSRTSQQNSALSHGNEYNSAAQPRGFANVVRGFTLLLRAFGRRVRSSFPSCV
jgi:hypothetical protein